jgi:hypothetical protein
MYCIESGQTQQCAQCQLIDGRLINKDGHVFPNCEGTQWVAIKSLSGTNNTPFYKVVPLPLDSWLLVGFMAVFGTLTILKNRVYEKDKHTI